METIIIDIPCKIGDEFNITPYTDIHDDSASCAHTLLREHMARRMSLPGARFISLGDLANAIFPSTGDYRSTPDTMINLQIEDLKDIAETKGVSDKAKLKMIQDVLSGPPKGNALIDQIVDRHIKKYSMYPWLFLGTGNHCTGALKHHLSDITQRVCDLIKVPCGGYSGLARLRFNLPNRNSHASLNLLYHHGAWGGQVIKGLGGAKRWAATFDDWDICLYGHNHQLHLHQEPAVRMNDRGTLVHRDVYIANCGTFLRGYRQGGPPEYGEQRGYPAVSLAAPLITVRITRDGRKLSLALGDI